MIILDTNVISEPLRPRPAPGVVRWLDRQSVATLHLTTVSLAELRYGVAALPDGRRKAALASRLDDEVLPLFSGRVLAFDVPAADRCGALRAEARATGHPIGLADAQIAAIAIAHGFAVATRDTAPFGAAGVEVIDPFAG